MKRSIIAGVGAYLPSTVVSNDELAKRVDTSDAWIRERTGIEQRYLATADESCAFMAARAAERALAHAGMTADDVDAILVATSTPDQVFPAVAVRVQALLGAKRGFGFDLSAACSGFVYGLSMGDALIRSGQAKGVLVIGAEVFSRLLDWDDRRTNVLFGDGAGAAFLRASTDNDDPARGILSTHLHSEGEFGDILFIDGANGVAGHPGTIVMNGREVFRHAVGKMAQAVEEAMAANDLTPADIDWLVPHQANLRIIEAMGKKLDLPPEKVVVTVNRHANTSAASIPLALNEAVQDGRIQPGSVVLMEALGGGLTWGSAILRM
ncbi:beta-ketoacyl-ACP synthase III [Granulibacter bethesdensis]|uniref:Beta-ketoacyl-[acyl-carrier-protein] synthase III n=2 Tax=Granulibacter bethesdensis TaxID=364410 RepID=FABH_GRABC|nr:beta-ketoacyl-ACP synthase III [Granulibacter bethesdensis]Q0BTE0.1 RecName: Full=Beta-ketoacyl-[acyl-carrier-protein] synthase III; Short=Beta-ketoacyl-ACP synthase III; Short=KAS III; AltName: Full=3-oxoacyl-[acyl-carrier-protein] synthase 3; AltName: Full=3-oxoacyl-[acyl-carrier-protein] synthase III [Granulibacter bethesdensis CGDNIH1]ABI61912.1 3-oxoacyl-[acyl-carrier-protein] synthase III [Granulibacter bethesdensis CGDNIH1]AHJ62849.1 3-oxoacyl-[acyl-carrier-protein] synthase III [Granu